MAGQRRHSSSSLHAGGDNTPSTFLKLSLPGTGRDFLFLGHTAPGNGSVFVPSRATAAGVMLDWGQIYASAVLADTKNDRTLLWGWVLNMYNVSAYANIPFDGALSLPRVIDTVEVQDPTTRGRTQRMPR